jgi:hypothetical protein
MDATTIAVCLFIVLVIVFVIAVYWSQTDSVFVMGVPYTTVCVGKNGRISYTRPMTLTTTESLNAYFEIPSRESFWSLSVYSNGVNVETVNTGDYQTVEFGDCVHVIITNNDVLVKSSMDVFREHHSGIARHGSCLTRLVNSFVETVVIVFEVYSVLPIRDRELTIVKLDSTVRYQPRSFVEHRVRESRLVEESCLFREYIENIPVSKRVNVRIANVLKKEIEFVSDVIDSDFCVYAVNHYKSRVGIHSHVLFVDAQTNEVMRMEFTGVKTNKVFDSGDIEIRRISFPAFDKPFRIVERVFFDVEDGYTLNADSVVPFVVLVH